MSFVSRLFDDPERVTDDGDPIGNGACGTHGGASRHTRRGEPLCVECRSFQKKYRREHYDAEARKAARAAKPERPESSARGTTKAAETAKALDAHRRARKQLQAELAAEAKRSA